jgi:hypothetical protein
VQSVNYFRVTPGPRDKKHKYKDKRWFFIPDEVVRQDMPTYTVIALGLAVVIYQSISRFSKTFYFGYHCTEISSLYTYVVAHDHDRHGKRDKTVTK